MRNNIEVLADGEEHETFYDLYKVNGCFPTELETALALAEGHLTGRFDHAEVKKVTIEKVRVRHSTQIVEEDDG